MNVRPEWTIMFPACDYSGTERASILFLFMLFKNNRSKLTCGKEHKATATSTTTATIATAKTATRTKMAPVIITAQKKKQQQELQ